MNKYNESSVIRSLSKKKASISINPYNRTIQIVRDNTEVGIHSWGKIDFLCKVCGYSYLFVKGFHKQSKVNNIDEIEINPKVTKRERKLDMAKMSKNAMKSNIY